jgi:hypothetical protein
MMLAVLLAASGAAPGAIAQHLPPDMSVAINQNIRPGTGEPSDYPSGYAPRQSRSIQVPPFVQYRSAPACSVSRVDFVQERYAMRRLYQQNKPASTRYSFAGYVQLARDEAERIKSKTP